MKAVFLFFTLLAVALSFILTDYDCPHDLEVKCIDSINNAYFTCDNEGSLDLECMERAISMGEECWPCICWVSEICQWGVKGC